MLSDSRLDENESPVATTAQYYAAAKAAIDTGDFEGLKSKLNDWRSDPASPGPNPEDIKYLVPRAAEGEGQPEALEYLLSLGGEICASTIGQTTSPTIFEIFISHGWKVDDSVFRSHLKHPDLVAFFLSHGANPNSKGSRGGFSPLDIAALRAPLETINLLRSHGATVGPDSRALHAAAQGEAPDRIPVMAYLLEQGADVNAFATDLPAPSEAMRSGRKGTALHTAYKWKSEDAKGWLLARGADPTIKNEAGETPEEWGRRFDSDGPERGLRLRRAFMRKNRAKNDKGNKDQQVNLDPDTCDGNLVI